MAADQLLQTLSSETLHRLKIHLLAAISIHTNRLTFYYQTLGDMLTGRLRTSLPAERARLDDIRMLEHFLKRVTKEPWFRYCEREWGEGWWEEAEEKGRERDLKELVKVLEEARRDLLGKGLGRGVMR